MGGVPVCGGVPQGCGVLRDRRAVYLGDRNSLNLTFIARNQGEGGAYEAELHVRPPPHAQYTGVLHPQGVWNLGGGGSWLWGGCWGVLVGLGGGLWVWGRQEVV